MQKNFNALEMRRTTVISSASSLHVTEFYIAPSEFVDSKLLLLLVKITVIAMHELWLNRLVSVTIYCSHGYYLCTGVLAGKIACQP